MQLINSESAYRMAHLPGNRSGWSDSNQRHLASKARTPTRLSYTQRPSSLRLRLPAPHPLSHYRWTTKPTVRAYPLESAEAASESCGMTAFLNRRRYLFAAQLLDASSTVCLAGSEGLRTTVRVDIEDPWLGAAGLPEFRPQAIQAYAIFAVPRDAAFGFFPFGSDAIRQPIACQAIARP